MVRSGTVHGGRVCGSAWAVPGRRVWGFAIHGHLCIHRNTRVCLPLFLASSHGDYGGVLRQKPHSWSAALIEPVVWPGISFQASACLSLDAGRETRRPSLFGTQDAEFSFPCCVILRCDLMVSGEMSPG